MYRAQDFPGSEGVVGVVSNSAPSCEVGRSYKKRTTDFPGTIRRGRVCCTQPTWCFLKKIKSRTGKESGATKVKNNAENSQCVLASSQASGICLLCARA